jgi:peroxiredoxin
VPLLSDWNGEAVRAFGVGHDWHGMHEVAERTAFLADAGGLITDAWRYETGELPDFDELVAAAGALS